MREANIYISYNKNDFSSSRSHDRAWIQSFIHTLQVLFIQTYSYEPIIHHANEEETTPNKQKEYIAQADVFIPIITTNYSQSQQCVADLKQFVSIHPNHECIFKVLKNDVPAQNQPDILAELHPYEFFEYDIDAEIIVEYNNTGRLPDYKYWVKLDDLAFEIQHLLDGNGKDRTGVYLASTTIDQKQVRDALSRNLKHQGFEIFPKESYDVKHPQLHEKIKENLAQCKLSVHLMGEIFGEIINPEGDSLVSLENEIALRINLESSSLKRIVWVPRDLHVLETKQQTYLEYLRAHKELQANSYYLETSLENLKAHMHNLLEEKVVLKEKQNNPSLFFATSGEIQGLTAIREQLKDQAIQVHTAEDFTYWSEHQVCLGNADVLLLVNAPNNNEWLNNWIKTLHKLKGYRTKEGKIKGLLVTEEPNALSGIKNLAKFKLIGLNEFKDSPDQIVKHIQGLLK